MRPGGWSRLATIVVALVLALAIVGEQGTVGAQTAAGATLTVLRGTAAVLRADGTPLSPAVSGQVVGVGDQVSSLARSSALITFFNGTELELGADTSLIIQELASQGGRTTITIKSVFGATLHRVVTLTDPQSTYRVEAGGSVAIVRGTTFAHYYDPGTGDVTVAVSDSEVEFPAPGAILRRGERRTYTSRGDTRTDTFDPAGPLFSVVTNPIVSSNPAGSLNPGLTAGNQDVPEQPDRATLGDDSGQKPPPAPTPVGLFLSASSAAGATRLEVTSSEGLAVGDTILINQGQANQETAVIVGFGSILVGAPLQYGHAAGEPFMKVNPPPAASTPLPTSTSTPLPTSTSTPTAPATVTPTATASTTATATPSPSLTQTLTATPTVTGTRTATSTGTATLTPTATSTGTQTATPTATATSTLTPTPTPTPTVPTGSTLRVSSGADTNTRDGVLTLREAVMLATGALSYGALRPAEQAQVSGNGMGASLPDVITFEPSVTTVSLGAALPALTGQDTIEGGSAVTIQGAGGFDCLTIASSSNTIRGLTIRGCATGITVASGTGNVLGGTGAGQRNVIGGNTTAGISIASNGNTVVASNIGTNAAGTAADANGIGIVITGANNTIGGTTTAARNLISGNTSHGVSISGGGATGNVIQGSYVGTRADGAAALANGGNGIQIDNAPSNTVGGTAGVTVGGPCTGACNLIAGNTQNGVNVVNGGATGNTVLGSFVGTDANGTAAVPNTLRGVYVDSAPSNTIGGTASGAGNVISGNTTNGVEINAASGNQVLGNLVGTNAAGTAALANQSHGIQVRGSTNTAVGSPGGGNLVSGSPNNGVDVTDSSSNTTIVANKVGTNLAGTAAIPNQVGIAVGNTVSGTQIGGTSGVTVGGPCTGVCNLISGSVDHGIFLFNSATNTIIQGNFIGTNLAGAAALPNRFGIDVGTTISSATIGGTSAGAGNLISGNAQGGIFLEGTTISVLGNRIGTNAAGTAAVANTTGIGVTGPNNTIGGTGAGAGNLISGNTNGVQVTSSGATNTQILGNRIGTDASGLAAVPNTFSVDLENSAANTTVGGTTGVTVGGDCTGSCNLIVGDFGIFAQQASTVTIVGNYVGTNVHGTAVLSGPSPANGIDIRYVPNATIGGTTAAQRNVIGGFPQCGINLQGLGGTLTTNAQVLGNYIGVGADNATLIPNGVGINVAEVSSAHIGDAVAGAGNVILGNTLKGIWLNDGSTTAVVLGNEIGRAGKGNVDDGIRISSSLASGDHQIGSIHAPEEANLIRFNGRSGIHVTSATIGNFFRGNSIEGNAVKGIELAPGANGDAAAPTLTSVDAGHILHLTTNATAGNIDVYNADALGQGKTYLLSNGPHPAGSPVDIALGASVTSGDVIVVTITDNTNNNTSEFSNSVTVP